MAVDEKPSACYKDKLSNTHFAVFGAFCLAECMIMNDLTS